jgi:DNA repair exonuclease SbcCD ATPase subunit
MERIERLTKETTEFSEENKSLKNEIEILGKKIGSLNETNQELIQKIVNIIFFFSKINFYLSFIFIFFTRVT